MKLRADTDEVPHIYLLHGLTNKTIPYPEELSDENRASVELITAWADVEKLKLDLEAIQSHLNDTQGSDEH